ncbi:MAG: S49 family peptidase [Planctomycetota bacterium]
MKRLLELRLWSVSVLAVGLALGSAAAGQETAEAAGAPAAVDAQTPEAKDSPAASPTGSTVGWIELNEPLREGPTPFAWIGEADAGPSLKSVLDRLAVVERGEDYAGVVIALDQPGLTMTQATAIAEAIAQVRAAGKQVLTFAEVYGLPDYVLASAADQVLLQHKGGVELSGIAVEEMYLAGMLEKIGVTPDFVQVGRFKGADEPLMREGPSEAWDENIGGLLDGLYAATLGPIMAGRGMTQTEVEALMADAWTLRDTELVERGAVDQLVAPDLASAGEMAFGTEFEWDMKLGQTAGGANPDNPFALFSMLFQEPQLRTSRPTLAVIHAQGAITSGESSFGGGLFSQASIGSRTMAGALEKALLDDNIKGVVIRLDSPGGSALASEVIWQAVREVGAEKPVFAVVGSMAASGGYYIVSGADRIYVQPHSILGSIGVVGGKITLGGLYDWTGVKVHRRTRGPGADLFNSVEPFTEPQRAKVRRAMEVVYDQFIERVEAGRGDRLPEVGQVAEGRLFTGATSLDNGMADRLGGLELALEELAEQTGLEPGGYDVVNLPGPMSLNEYLSDFLGVRSGGASTDLAGLAGAAGAQPGLKAAERLVGPAAWRSVSRSLQGLLLLRHEPVLLMMPAAIVVK